MLRKSMIDQYAIRYDEGLPKAQDYGLWVSCSRVGKIRIIPKVLLRYRVHEKQISTAFKEEQRKFADSVSKKQFDRMGIKWRTEFSQWRAGIVSTADDAMKMWDWLKAIEQKNQEVLYLNSDKLAEYANEFMLRTIKHLRRKERLLLLLKGELKLKNIVIRTIL